MEKEAGIYTIYQAASSSMCVHGTAVSIYTVGP